MTKNRRRDDPSSAPESGTDRDETTGNQPAHPDERMSGLTAKRTENRPAGEAGDDESTAGEEP